MNFSIFPIEYISLCQSPTDSNLINFYSTVRIASEKVNILTLPKAHILGSTMPSSFCCNIAEVANAKVVCLAQAEGREDRVITRYI